LALGGVLAQRIERRPAIAALSAADGKSARSEAILGGVIDAAATER
jgi:hypothetical protein